MSKGVPVDYTVQKIIEQIHKELRKDGKFVSTDSILEIINTQFKCVAEAIRNGDHVYLLKFGTFKFLKDVEIRYNLNRENPNDSLVRRVNDRGLAMKIKFKTKDEILPNRRWDINPE